MKWCTIKSILSLSVSIFPHMIFIRSLVMSIWGDEFSLSIISMGRFWLVAFLFLLWEGVFSMILPSFSSYCIEGRTNFPIMVVPSLKFICSTKLNLIFQKKVRPCFHRAVVFLLFLFITCCQLFVGLNLFSLCFL